MLRRFVDRLLDFMCALVMSTIVIVTLSQVLNRYVVQHPVTWTDEIARFLAVWVVLLGAARCVREGSHIQIDIIYDLLGPRLQWCISLLVAVLFSILALVLFWQTMKIMPVIAPQTAAASRISMAWVYAAAPVSTAMMLFYLGERIVHLLRDGATPKLADRADADIV
ncbi:MAG: TRAP transporter small permease [Gammaproteobacteria bacterium]|nr:TRAP transporter small permease [Gammaproteobacteria bacterium]